jgi:hypothetical protein
MLVAMTLAAMQVADSAAFDGSTHRGITRDGLSRSATFLRPAIQGDIDDEHEYMDEGFPWSSRGGEDQRHFDDCEFDGSVAFIRDRYADARRALERNDPFDATDAFGDALHPAQDFYAHSNWVEMGYPRGSQARRQDLVDLSGAQDGLYRQWGVRVQSEFDPLRRDSLRGNILLGSDDLRTTAAVHASTKTAPECTSRR